MFASCTSGFHATTSSEPDPAGKISGPPSTGLAVGLVHVRLITRYIYTLAALLSSDETTYRGPGPRSTSHAHFPFSQSSAWGG